jgi:hypothetical protein
MWVAQPIRRDRHAPWFSLVGELTTRPRQFVLLGDSLTEYEAPVSGELVAFANDVKHFNFNNQGCLLLTVVRLK